MSTIVSTQVQLVARPQGWPVPSDFATVQVTYGDLQPGQVRVLNEFVSVDPYMRGRMNDVKSYAPPYALGETMTGGAIGGVIESADERVPVGAVVLHQLDTQPALPLRGDLRRAVGAAVVDYERPQLPVRAELRPDGIEARQQAGQRRLLVQAGQCDDDQPGWHQIQSLARK